MNTVSLGLSKELYELSGWKTGRHFWSMKNPKLCQGDNFMDGMSFTAYDLGYLVRKLPEELGNKRFIFTNGERPHAGYADRDNYGDHSLGGNFYRDACYADTPEDAAAKLAIVLFKQGILKRGDGNV